MHKDQHLFVSEYSPTSDIKRDISEQLSLSLLVVHILKPVELILERRGSIALIKEESGARVSHHEISHIIIIRKSG